MPEPVMSVQLSVEPADLVGQIGRTVTDLTSQPATAEIYQPPGVNASRHAIAHPKAMITQL
jgi:hypothetical protein